MLIAQTHLGEHLAKPSAILCEERGRFLVDLCVGSLHWNSIGGIEVVGIRTMIVTLLATEGEIALPYGIAKDEFRSPEVIAADGVAFDASVDRTATCFRRHFLGIAR